MSIKGTKIVKGKYGQICYINDFSAGLQIEIRKRLSQIFHGAFEVKSSPDFYSYSNTLKSFIDRYKDKDPDVKKGIMGELLAHLLIGLVFTSHHSISILKNKEERNVKKGFDIVYYDTILKKMWYSEVKSGNSSSGESSSNYNTTLLTRAKRDIDEKLSSQRNSIWEGAMIDATLAIRDNAKRTKLKQLLADDSPMMTRYPSLRKNAIMVSVLYHGLSDKIDISSVDTFYADVLKEKKFLDFIVFSIQKATYTKIERFIIAEQNEH